MNKKLFIPRPVDAREGVLQKISTSMIGYRGEEPSQLQKSISEKLQRLFYTESTMLLSTSSGTRLTRLVIHSCTSKKSVEFSSESFGDRLYKIVAANNVPEDLLKVEMGKRIELEIVEKVLSTAEYDLITVTHNETSTEIRNPIEEIGEVVKNHNKVIYCVDVVNSASGIKI